MFLDGKWPLNNIETFPGSDLLEAAATALPSTAERWFDSPSLLRQTLSARQLAANSSQLQLYLAPVLTRRFSK